MDLAAVTGNVLITLLGAVISVREVQQQRSLGSLEQWRLAPHRHHLLYLLHVLLGALQPTV